ncbi:MAG: hypothetical protein B7X04_01900 [Parcubacteria group bacterium 21-54-25]|nr:MAG: hypothetical protein B7X04_01900 [Parcubacteria group bacterium 21-54-25]HQU07673.1 DUF5671 domain-containing protein [Candidatus Paceibacterota bacterium]
MENNTRQAVRSKATPKDFFLWAGAMIALYVSVFSFISLVFDYFNYAFPDPLQYYAPDPYLSGVSYEMASLIVLFPLFLVLMRLIHKSIERDDTRADVWVRRWALYLTLFIAGATIAGDMVTLVMYFFNGDVTLRFALKVLVILLVTGGGFLHFLADLRGYWKNNPAKARVLGWMTSALVVLTIVAGFLIIGTPWQVRLYRYDAEKVSDLQNIQSEIVSYWQAKQVLPAALSDLNYTIVGYTVPTDPQTGESYEYHVTGALAFTLCATFNAPTQATHTLGERALPVPLGSVKTVGVVGDVWTHGAGQTCFKRTIDASRSAPVK